MPETGSNETGGGRQPRSRPHGVIELAAASLGSFIDYLDARIRLLSLEAREARGALLRRIVAVAAGAFFVVIAYLCLLTGAIALAADHFERPWPTMALIAGGIHLALGVGLLLAARSRLRGSPFRDTRRELDKDRQWLNDLRPPE